ncbi:MAG: biopolymer transporter ExbD [Gammaproteobacteria bacterium]|nr:biopolymer transporter ExbD [Gammaproteobacteria bacterium]
MNLRPQRKDDVDINITPLIDVVFLMLIFFMVSTTFKRESEVNITLPEASEEYTEPKLDTVEVGVDAQGVVYVNGRKLINSQLLTIREALRDAALDLKDPPVIISADAQATHQSVIRIMDAARQLGLVHITFATQKIEHETPE